jgi:hypothetical protein
MLFASFMMNTGAILRNGKGSGEEGSESPTKLPRSSEESEHGKAVYTRIRTDGEDPEPLERRKQRYLANAQAVHGWTPVELET